MNFVSVIVPCYNEEKNIGNLLDALNQQSYPKELLEIIIVDGQSTDQTLNQIHKAKNEFQDLNIQVSTNSKRKIPSAVNIGIKESSGDIIIRMDAHSIPDTRYIEYCVELLEKKVAENVGGRWIIVPGAQSKISKCISLAASHPFGVGDAKYRFSSEAGYVDTVPYGAFYKSLVNEIGYFNEELQANEDYEFNVRIRKSGKRIYFDPKIQTQYIARDTIKGLSKQYWRYGFWKFQMLKRYPDTIRMRQAVPPIFVAGLFTLAVLSLIVPEFWKIFFIFFLFYSFILINGTVIRWKRENDLFCLIGIPISIIVMHFSWGLGFIYSLIKTGLGRKIIHG